jgi:hypothetical protein
MRGVRYLGQDGLPPRPDPATGLPRPPHAPGRTGRGTSKRSPDRDDALTNAPAPPPDQGSILVWYRSSRSYAVQVGSIGFVVATLLLSARDGFQFHWVKYWWAWIGLFAIAFLIGLTQRKGAECSAGVEWVRGRKTWVRTYDLVKAKLSVGIGQFYLSMEDSDGRSLSLPVSALQEDRLMWDLVYNGLLYSVIAGGAETNGQLHRYLRVPYPSPYNTAQ